MPNYTIHKLISGDQSIIEHYKNAKNLWLEILNCHSALSIEILAEELTNRQHQFELLCGGKELGQEIMVVVGIGQFYSTELGIEHQQEMINTIFEAFRNSNCSVEVKLWANKSARFFHMEHFEEILI